MDVRKAGHGASGAPVTSLDFRRAGSGLGFQGPAFPLGTVGGGMETDSF